VVFPFLPPERIDDEVIGALREIVRAVPRSRITFSHVDWFDDRVVWLAPRPDRPFRDLTTAVWRRFAEAPPYDGAHADIVPHLTIGHDAPVPVLSDAARAVSVLLPIVAAVETVRLIAGAPEPRSWHTLREFPLGT
jgi:2'-5' RNA ligase